MELIRRLRTGMDAMQWRALKWAGAGGAVALLPSFPTLPLEALDAVDISDEGTWLGCVYLFSRLKSSEFSLIYEKSLYMYMCSAPPRSIRK
mmetsp:Transcript_14720/g.27941  ORF Transcript_14720/g.27941 Transcript_14720/m.27941 type:complete len:91 (+) Transcript_14720:378-650(+)